MHNESGNASHNDRLNKPDSPDQDQDQDLDPDQDSRGTGTSVHPRLVRGSSYFQPLDLRAPTARAVYAQ